MVGEQSGEGWHELAVAYLEEAAREEEDGEAHEEKKRLEGEKEQDDVAGEDRRERDSKDQEPERAVSKVS